MSASKNHELREREMMEMKKIVMVCAIAMLVCMNASMAQAQAKYVDLELKAGSSSVSGSASYIKPLYSGYMKIGGSGVYSDNAYQWGGIHLLVGSETLSPGLMAEVGLKGIFGSAEEHSYEGDIGAVAFTGRLVYALRRRNETAIPLEAFCGMSFAPGPLSFLDTGSYLDMMVGIGIRIIDQASLEISFHQYDIDMEEGPGSWELDENEVRLGISMRF
jgi:hypothetical protein